MKILQIMPNFALAGAEIMCENLIVQLKRQGHEVVVLSLYDYHSAITDRLEAQKIDVRYLQKKSGFDISMIGKISKIIRQEKPDVIHTHRYVAQYAIPASIGKVKVRLHTVHSVATKELESLARKLQKLFYKSGLLVPVALSEAVKETVISEYSLGREVPVVFNGIDLSKCIPKSSYRTDGTFKILHIGRMSQEKNHVCLIDAFDIFQKTCPQSELMLIGDGPLRSEIEEYVKKLNLSDKVKFLGLQDNVYSFLNMADVFVLSSFYEGIPMTLIEAMGTGLPIVATNVGGIPDMLVNGESAYLTAVDSVEIADKLLLLSDNEDLRKNIGANAKTASIRFSAENMGNEYVKLYRKYGETKK